VPGVAPDDVEITVLGDTLRIRAERRDEQQKGGEGQRWIVREQRFGAFERAVRLPTAVKADAAQAEFKHGVLTISLPKADEAKERKIPIGRGQSGGQSTDVPIEAAGHQSPQERAQTADQSAASTKAAG
jgi:HSP20 family protein